MATTIALATLHCLRGVRFVLPVMVVKRLGVSGVSLSISSWQACTRRKVCVWVRWVHTAGILKNTAVCRLVIMVGLKWGRIARADFVSSVLPRFILSLRTRNTGRMRSRRLRESYLYVLMMVFVFVSRVLRSSVVVPGRFAAFDAKLSTVTALSVVGLLLMLKLVRLMFIDW